MRVAGSLVFSKLCVERAAYRNKSCNTGHYLTLALPFSHARSVNEWLRDDMKRGRQRTFEHGV